MSIKHGNRIFMTPSGLQKERMTAADIFVLDSQGTILHHPWSAAGTRFASCSKGSCSGFLLATSRCRPEASRFASLHLHRIAAMLTDRSCLRVEEVDACPLTSPRLRVGRGNQCVHSRPRTDAVWAMNDVSNATNHEPLRQGDCCSKHVVCRAETAEPASGDAI